jgi:hypothetical protein
VDPPGKIELIHNGVPIPDEVSQYDIDLVRTQIGLGQSEHLVAFVGRLVPQKNPGLFVQWPLCF